MDNFQTESETATAFQAPGADGSESITSFLQREKDKKEKKFDTRADKMMLAEQTSALLSSVRTARDHLQREMNQHPGGNYADRLAEYETIESNATSVMESLVNAKTPSSLAMLSNVESSLSSDLKLWEDSDQKKKAQDEERAGYIATELMVKEDTALEIRQQRALEENETMGMLHSRKLAINNILSANEDLSTQATSIATDGTKDLLASIGLAEIMYEGYRKHEAAETTQAKMDEFVEKQKTAMRGDETSGALEESINNRITAIKQAAEQIHSGTMQSHEEGGRQILKVTDQFVNNPLREQMDASATHFGHASTHLKHRVDHKIVHAHRDHEHFKSHVKDWSQLRDTTQENINSQMAAASAALSGFKLSNDVSGKDLYDGLKESIGTNKIIAHASHYADHNTKLMHKQAGIFKEIHDRTDSAETELTKLLMGKSRNVQISEEIGMKPSKLRSDVMIFQIQNDIPVDKDLIAQVSRDAQNILRSGNAQISLA